MKTNFLLMLIIVAMICIIFGAIKIFINAGQNYITFDQENVVSSHSMANSN